MRLQCHHVNSLNLSLTLFPLQVFYNDSVHAKLEDTLEKVREEERKRREEEERRRREEERRRVEEERRIFDENNRRERANSITSLNNQQSNAPPVTSTFLGKTVSKRVFFVSVKLVLDT